MIGAIVIPPATAADLTTQKASTGAAVACDPLQDQCMTAPAKENTSQYRIQRKAGPPSLSPALALAMALGFRNVQGPVERRQQVMVRKDNPSSGAKQVFLLPHDGVSKRTSSNAAGIRLALED